MNICWFPLHSIVLSMDHCSLIPRFCVGMYHTLFSVSNGQMASLMPRPHSLNLKRKKKTVSGEQSPITRLAHAIVSRVTYFVPYLLLYGKLAHDSDQSCNFIGYYKMFGTSPKSILCSLDCFSPGGMCRLTQS